MTRLLFRRSPYNLAEYLVFRTGTPTMVLFTGVFMVGVDVAMTGIAAGGRS